MVQINMCDKTMRRVQPVGSVPHPIVHIILVTDSPFFRAVDGASALEVQSFVSPCTA